MFVDKYIIRQQNEATVLEEIIQFSPISRAAVSQKTGLNKATVSDITRKLIEDKLISEIGSGESSTSGGRKPIMLTFNKYVGTVLSLDLGYDYAASSLSYLDGELIFGEKQKNLFINKENVLTVIHDIIKNYQAYPNQGEFGIVGITIAIHGIVEENQIIFTPYYDLDQMELYTELTKLYPYPIFLENEANLTAIAESTFSSQYDQLVSLSIHSGIGAGIIINGKLYKGRRGRAGEIGHSTLIPHGKKCPCGNEGCLEQYASENAILKKYQQLTGESLVSPDFLAQKYSENQPEAGTVIAEMTDYLTIGVNNVITNFAPEIVYLNSPIIRRIPEIAENIAIGLTSSFNRHVIIVSSSLGSKASLYGAASVSIKNFLNIKNLKLIDTKTIQF